MRGRGSCSPSSAQSRPPHSTVRSPSAYPRPLRAQSRPPQKHCHVPLTWPVTEQACAGSVQSIPFPEPHTL
eukprot:3807195-Rhodomonas_salina.1